MGNSKWPPEIGIMYFFKVSKFMMHRNKAMPKKLKVMPFIFEGLF
jgi:hypothetical protein